MKTDRPARVMNPNEINLWARAVSSEYTARKAWTNYDVKGAVRDYMQSHCPNDRTRGYVCGIVFGNSGDVAKPMHLERCSDAQWLTLKRWISASKDSEGEWKASSQFMQEIGVLRFLIENGPVRI